MKTNTTRIGIALSAALVLFARAAFAAATVAETEIEMPTYPYSDPDPLPATDSVRYPYFVFSGSSATSVPKKWKAVVLENEKIKVTILPEIGGKIWGATDKATGTDFIYFNHAVKFRNIAQRGPWTSGGIEFNFGVFGHAPSTSTPVSYFCRTNADGSTSCFLSDTELVCRTTWQVEVNLPADADSFLTRTTWYNGSGFPSSYYHWMNAAYSLRGDPEFFFPGEAYASHDGVPKKWPVDDKGRDLSRYSNNAFGRNKSYHVLSGDSSFYGIWWPEKGIGSYHLNDVADKHGRKIWLWGLSREGAIWEDLLTDSDGQYAELQSGKCFVQAQRAEESPQKNPTFAPGATDVFAERWGVARSRGDLERYMSPSNFVKRPLAATNKLDMTTAYGHYLKGRELLVQKFDRKGEEELRKCLEKEPCFVPALGALASLSARRGKYSAAHEFAERALAVDTYDPKANYADGQAYFAEGNAKYAAERFGVAALSPLFKSQSLVYAARLALRNEDWEDADGKAASALASNALNLDAWLVRMIAARRRGDSEAAACLARTILDSVPLFHAARYELNLSDVKSEPMEKYVRCEMPHEAYLEIGSWYEESGLRDDAERFFRLASNNPIGAIRLAHLKSSPEMLDGVASAPIAFALPFRRESLPALLWAAKARSEWKFAYYAAVGLAANAYDEKADEILAAYGDRPDDETFYLYRASRSKGNAKLSDLRRAVALAKSWRPAYALYRHFADVKDWENALAAIEPCVVRFPDVDPVKIAYATALARSGAYEKAIDYMRGITVLPSEHGGNAMKPWAYAWGRIAMAALERFDYAAAKDAVEKAISYPENLGCGKPYNFPLPGSGGKFGPFDDWPYMLRWLVDWTSWTVDSTAFDKVRAAACDKFMREWTAEADDDCHGIGKIPAMRDAAIAPIEARASELESLARRLAPRDMALAAKCSDMALRIRAASEAARSLCNEKRDSMKVFMERFKFNKIVKPFDVDAIAAEFAAIASNAPVKDADELLEKARVALDDSSKKAEEVDDVAETVAAPRRAAEFRKMCAEAGQSGAFCLGQATSMEKIWPRIGVLPRPAKSLDVRLARDEKESVQLFVMPKDGDLSGVRVRIGELKNEAGTTLPASAISVSVLGYVNITNGSPYGIGFNIPTNNAAGYVRAIRACDRGWCPDPILSFMDRTDVRRDDIQGFWIRIHAPEDQKPGMYRGAATVSADGVESATIQMSVRVNAFSVPKTPMLPLAVTFVPRHSAKLSNKAIHEIPDAPYNTWTNRLDEWCDFITDRYLSFDSLYNMRGKPRDPDFAMLDRQAKRGLNGMFNIGYWDGPSEDGREKWIAEKLPKLKRAYEEVKRRGLLDRAYVYGCDEKLPNTFADIAWAAKILHKELPGAKLMVTAYDLTYGMDSPLSDIDCFVAETEMYNPARAQRARAAGKQVWWYFACSQLAPCANSFIEGEAIEMRSLLGAQSVKYRPDGFLYYSIAFWDMTRPMSGKSPFTDWNAFTLKNLRGDGGWTCCGPDNEPVSTIRLENFADGLEDYAYAKMLEKRLSENPGKTPGWTEKAKALVAVPRRVVESVWNFSNDPQAIYGWRNAMADMIESE